MRIELPPQSSPDPTSRPAAASLAGALDFGELLEAFSRPAPPPAAPRPDPTLYAEFRAQVLEQRAATQEQEELRREGYLNGLEASQDDMEELVWPLELCAQQLDGLSRYASGALAELRPWQGALIDSRAYWSEIAAEMRWLDLPRASAADLDAPAARLGHTQADWCLEIGLAACAPEHEGGCGGLERSGVLKGVSLPAGMLELHAADQGELCLAALAPGRAAFSYRHSVDRDRAETGFWQSLSLALPDQGFREQVNLGWRPACRCRPRLKRDRRHLQLLLPPAGLAPSAQVLQSIGWIAALALGRWLGEELQALDRLPADLDAYLQKVMACLPGLSKSYRFLELSP